MCIESLTKKRTCVWKEYSSATYPAEIRSCEFKVYLVLFKGVFGRVDFIMSSKSESDPNYKKFIRAPMYWKPRWNFHNQEILPLSIILTKNHKLTHQCYRRLLTHIAPQYQSYTWTLSLSPGRSRELRVGGATRASHFLHAGSELLHNHRHLPRGARILL